MKEYTHEEWIQEAKKRFGDDPMKWKFVCPECGHVQTPKDFKDIGKDPDLVYVECIGRHVKDKGCNWCAYGFLKTCGEGVIVKRENGDSEIFGFAEGNENE